MLRLSIAVGALVAVACSRPGWAQNDNLPSQEEMWQIILEQQRQIDNLTERLDDTADRVDDTQVQVEETQAQVEETDAKVEATADVLEEGGGLGGWWDRTSLGGYAELHYNAGEKDEIDLHRFVLFVGHEFDEDIRFASEIEIEHALAGDGKPGEVEIEQAFVEFDFFDDTQQARAGVFLLPIGILNETHEPPTFYGVERNRVENVIIPTTWWEGGVGANGQIYEGFSYDLAFHSGLRVPVTGANAFRIRSGRQKVAEAVAKDPAVTGRILWTGMPGVEIGASGQYQFDIAQNQLADAVEATLFEAHADIQLGGFGLRALFARWDLSGAAPEALGRDVQYGWYVEPSYRFLIDPSVGEMGVFIRYSHFDTAGGDNIDSGMGQYDVGINYWPIPDVVLKADFEWQEAPDGLGIATDHRLNLGVGLQF